MMFADEEHATPGAEREGRMDLAWRMQTACALTVSPLRASSPARPSTATPSSPTSTSAAPRSYLSASTTRFASGPSQTGFRSRSRNRRPRFVAVTQRNGLQDASLPLKLKNRNIGCGIAPDQFCVKLPFVPSRHTVRPRSRASATNHSPQRHVSLPTQYCYIILII